MIQLPFNKRTLSFINQEYEQQYEKEQKSLRLFNYRLLFICLAITCLFALIVFVTQSQPIILILLMASLTASAILFLIFSSRLADYIKYVFTLCFILSLGGGVFISLSAFKIPQFLYGFNTGVLVIFILQHIDNKVKLFIVIGSPIILLEIFSLYDLQNLQYVAFSVSGAIMIGTLLHQQEYNQRVCFSIKILNQKQMDIIDEYLNDPLLAISFNNRTRQFELEFMNQQLRQQFAIHDIESMKDFLRNTSITKETNLFKSTETQFKKSQQITSEEYLYEVSEKNVQEDNLFIHYIKKESPDSLKKIIIKKINYGKPIMLIMIKCQQKLKDNYEKNKQLQLFKNTITDQLQYIGRELQQLLKKVNKNIDLQSMGLMIFNQVKNSILYLNQDKLQLLSQDVETIPFNKFINSLNTIFICLSKRKNKNFLNINTVEKEFIIKLNTKFLLQILINIFEFTLDSSSGQATIILSITQDLQSQPFNNEGNKLQNSSFLFRAQKKSQTLFLNSYNKTRDKNYSLKILVLLQASYYPIQDLIKILGLIKNIKLMKIMMAYTQMKSIFIRSVIYIIYYKWEILMSIIQNILQYFYVLIVQQYYIIFQNKFILHKIINIFIPKIWAINIMIQLPFNKWTLQFHCKELEDKYQENQRELRLFCFRVFSISFTLICFLSLIVAIAQQQTEAQILLRSGLVLLCIALVFMNKLLSRVIRQAFAFCFIVSIVGTTYISLNAFLIPQFMYGFNTSSLAVFLLQHIDNRIKMIILFSLPFIQLSVFSLFNLNNIQYIPFTITSAIMFGIVSYIHEYYQKLAFSLNDVVINQREVIHEYVDHALLTVSLCERSNQFSLEFHNKKSKEEYNISNSDQMKQFFRTSFLKDQGKNQVNLEQYLYSQKDNKSSQMLEFQTVKDGVIQQKKICIQSFYYGKPVLLIRIITDQNESLINKYDHQINHLHTATIIQFQQTAHSLQKLLKDIKILKSKSCQYDILYYHSLSIMNQVKNQLVYLHQDIIKTLKQDIKVIPLNNFVDAMTPFFTCQTSQQKQRFELLNLNKRNVFLKINVQILTQILINLFEFSLDSSQRQGRIALRISTESNLNPLMEREIKTTNNFLKPAPIESNSLEKQQLIKFQFSFYSKEIVDLESSTSLKVSRLLLAFISPYNDIQSSSCMDYHLNKISFYIYSDQSQLDTSYTKNMKK